MGGHDHCCATGCTSRRGDVEDGVRLSQTVIVVWGRFPSDILQSTDKYGVLLLSLTRKNGVWQRLTTFVISQIS